MDKHAFLKVQSRAFNAQDVDSVVGQYAAEAQFIRDGELVAEGRDGVAKVFQDEYKRLADRGGVISRLALVDDDEVLVEYTGDEGRGTAEGIIRFEDGESGITMCWIDHDPTTLQKLA